MNIQETVQKHIQSSVGIKRSFKTVEELEHTNYMTLAEITRMKAIHQIGQNYRLDLSVNLFPQCINMHPKNGIATFNNPTCHKHKSYLFHIYCLAKQPNINTPWSMHSTFLGTAIHLPAVNFLTVLVVFLYSIGPEILQGKHAKIFWKLYILVDMCDHVINCLILFHTWYAQHTLIDFM
ncbi:hypothetical protein ACJX0J_018754, partial [Zea mays]